MAGVDDDRRPLEKLAETVNDLLARNDRTNTASAGEMYLGKDILVVRLRRPVRLV